MTAASDGNPQRATFSLRTVILAVLACGIVFGVGRAIWRHNRGGAMNLGQRDREIVEQLRRANPQATILFNTRDILPEPAYTIPLRDGYYSRVVLLYIESKEPFELLPSLADLEHLDWVSIEGDLGSENAHHLAQVESLGGLRVRGVVHPLALSLLRNKRGRQMRRLSLRGSRLVRDELVLKDLASGWPELEELDLGRTGVTPAGIEQLGKRTAPIKTVNLEHVPLSREMVDALLAMYANWKLAAPQQFFRLEFTCGEMSEEDVKRLTTSGLVNVFCRDRDWKLGVEVQE